MEPDTRSPRPAFALSLTPLNVPNPYLGMMILTEWGAQSIIDSFSGGVPCDVVFPDGQLLLRVEDLRIDDNQLVALVVAPGMDELDRVGDAVKSGEVEPIVRIELKMPLDGVVLGAPARIDQAELLRVRFELVAGREPEEGA
jgi:hypothetical protein